MVMKVGNISPLMFRSISPVTKPDNNFSEQVASNNLDRMIPAGTVRNIQNYPALNIDSYKIHAPQRYTKIGEAEINGGLKLHTYKLANGLKVSIIPMEGSPAIVKNYVNVGSLNETDDIKGISHFLEHMAFNGTNGENGYIKLNQGDSFKKIDKLGGWINASTNYAVTDYINSTPLLEEKDLEEQIKIIAGMTEDLALTPEMIEKEKGPVCSEINMILDSPQTILMDQTVRTLFNIKSSADELIGGSTEHIKNLTREKVKAYYDKYYTPDNMNLVVTGDVNPETVMQLVSKNFRSNKISNGKKYEEKLTPIESNVRKDFISDKANSNLIMLGFTGPANNDVKSTIIYKILQEYLHSRAFGLDAQLKELNAFTTFGKEKVSNNPYNPTMIYYGVESSEENYKEVLKNVYSKLSQLKAPDNKELGLIKERLATGFKMNAEYSSDINNLVGYSILNGGLDYVTNFEEILNSITTEDVQKFIDEYIRLDKAALTVVHPKSKSINTTNPTSATVPTFKSKRVPINTSKIEEATLDNNYKIGFYETNNDRIAFDIKLKYDIPKDINPATLNVFAEILEAGTKYRSEKEFIKIQENNNFNIYTNISRQSLMLTGESDHDNLEKTIKLTKELLYSPRITEEEVEKAVKRIKDSLSRAEDTAASLYVEHESKINPLYTSNKDILQNIDKVTVEDVKKLHQYILKNSSGIIDINNPKNKDIKDLAISEFRDLESVKPHEFKLKDVYRENKDTVVLTKDKNVSQADIMQTFKFKAEENPKEIVTSQIMNTLLSSSSIGLFNTLREKEHLAYSVHSNIDRLGNCGKLSCSILTTTDNKDTGEQSFDNIQKSINGFNRQINALINSQYTDDDLESAKRILKADMLNNEGVFSKLANLRNILDKNKGIDYQNQIFNEIDKITRDDIKAFAQKVFKNPPIYSIVASKDTLEANKGFLENLK